MKVTRVSGFPGLYREELGKEGARFRILIRRNGKQTQEYFYFGAKRSVGDALVAAIRRWRKIRKAAPVLLRAAFAEVERRKSRSGIVGVRRVRKSVKGREYHFWEGWWSDLRHRRRVRGFSVDKYGEREAKKMAIRARRAGLAGRADK
jgi:hypothetical protein